MEKIKNECPFCAKVDPIGIQYLTYLQANNSEYIDMAAPDEKWKAYNYRVGGVPLGKFERRYIPDKGEKLKYMTSTGRIETATEYFCEECHNNITPLIRYKNCRFVTIPLIGLPGASKTALAASIFKYVLEGRCKANASIVTGTKTFEYNYYYDICTKYPEIPPPTNHEGENAEIYKLHRQPMMYIKVNNTILVFVDLPGENFKRSNFYIPENSTPFYLFDPTLDISMQKTFFSKIFQEVHENGRHFDHEVIGILKCDLVPDIEKKIMVKSMEEGKKTFEELYKIRKTKTKFSPVPMVNDLYQRISNSYNCRNVDVIAAAAFGCNAKEEEDGKFRLVAEWNPIYLSDLLSVLSI